MLNEKYGGIIEALEVLKGLGFTPKELLEVTKEFYKEHSEGTKDSCIPRIRTTSAFRKKVERCAISADKSLTDYIYSAVEKENKRLLGGNKE